MKRCARQAPCLAAQNQTWGMIPAQDGNNRATSVRTDGPLRRRLATRMECEICGPAESLASIAKFHLPFGSCCPDYREERGGRLPRRRRRLANSVPTKTL